MDQLHCRIGQKMEYSFQTWGKIITANYNKLFLELCLENHVCSTVIGFHISRSRLNHSPTIECSFINDVIQKLAVHIEKLKEIKSFRKFC